ncbi:hypothetical protein GGX14DRAFT_383527, partial [Mycena pura]
LPINPPDWRSLKFGTRITRDRLEAMLAKIKPNTLTESETNLIAYVVIAREYAFAWNFAEKGFFSREYYPDYEYPVIEHTPWQKHLSPFLRSPSRRCKVIDDGERDGRFEPTVSSYRCAMFPVAKKPGSDPPIRIILNLEPLNGRDYSRGCYG